MGIVGNLKSPKCVCGWQWANVFFMFFPSRTKGTRFWPCLVFKRRVVARNHVEPCLTVLCTPGRELMMFLGVPDPFLAESNRETPFFDPSILQGLEFPGSPFLQTEVLGQFSTQRGSKASSCDPR